MTLYYLLEHIARDNYRRIHNDSVCMCVYVDISSCAPIYTGIIYYPKAIGFNQSTIDNR